MSQNEFQKICSKWRVPINSEPDSYNFQFQPGGIDSGYLLNVPDEEQDEFYDLYYDLKVKKKKSSSLLEKPLPNENILKIDLDFKNNVNNEDLIDSSELKHKYQISDVEEFIKEYLICCQKYFKLPKDCEISILEKKSPKLKEKNNTKFIKDGIHIMCPDIVVYNEILHSIRNDFINSDKANEIFKTFGNLEPIETCVDERVISTNAWFPIGSGKPDDKNDYYKITNRYNLKISNKNKITLEKTTIPKITCNLIKKYSNYKKKLSVKMNSNINLNELKNIFNKNNNKNRKNVTMVDMLLVKAKNNKNIELPDTKYYIDLLNCLSKDRYENYQNWFNVGFCLFNIHPGLYNVWKAWSSQCKEKYEEKSCEIMWYHTFYQKSEKFENLNLNQLKNYAKKDNPKLFKEIEKENITRTLDNIVLEFMKKRYPKMYPGAAKFAQLLNNYIDDCCDWQVICSDPTSHTWFKFEDNVWEEDKGANKIQIMIVENLLTWFEIMHNHYELEKVKEIKEIHRNQYNYDDNNNLLLLNRNNNNEESIINEYQQLLNSNLMDNKLIVTRNILKFLESHANRNTLIKDLETLRYDPKFYENLDQNPNVFICNNCVLDFKTLEIRNGLPSDMNSINCGIAFPKDTNSREAQAILIEIEDFLEKIFPVEEIRDYVLNLCAESLCGLIVREEFFIHTGSGSNGKSVFGDLISKTLGNYFYAPPNEIFNTPKGDPSAPNPIIAGVKGKRYVMVSEPKKEKTLQSDIIKQFSGCDPITGRHLHKEPIIFKPQCKWNMACNDIPEMDSTDEGIWRRVKVIPYVAKFVSPDDNKLKNSKRYPYHYPKDPSIKEKLDIWAPYFLYKLWNRYTELNKVNFDVFNDSNIPDAVKRATKEYKKESNVYEQFFENKCEEKGGFRQNVNEVYSEFKRYNQDNDYNKKITKSSFLTQIQRFMGKPRTYGKEKYFMDFTIIDAGEEYGN